MSMDVDDEGPPRGIQSQGNFGVGVHKVTRGKGFSSDEDGDGPSIPDIVGFPADGCNAWLRDGWVQCVAEGLVPCVAEGWVGATRG